MIQIRPVEGVEAEKFLKLLCEVFDLDFDRARSVFFQEPFFDLKRKWALFEHGEMVSVLTSIPLQFGWGRASGIAGVATRVPMRGRGYATSLIRTAVNHGERPAFLFAKEPGIYESAGFKAIDHVVRAKVAGNAPWLEDALTHDEVRSTYTAWSESHPNRLLRDDRRWEYWSWNMRIANRFDSGYLCQENDMVRECVTLDDSPDWPAESQWYGLQSMANLLGLTLIEVVEEASLMAFGSEAPPQMFMTDQF